MATMNTYTTKNHMTTGIQYSVVVIHINIYACSINSLEILKDSFKNF